MVGGVCGALIIVGILVWFLCRRHRRRRHRRQSKTDTSTISEGTPALQPGARYESTPNELGDTTRREPAELDGSLDRKEAPDTAQVRHELAGQQPSELP